MKRMLVLVGVAGVFATLASAAVAGSGQGQARQLTGKVTSVTARSITVKAGTSSLTCAARAGLRFGTFMGKRATMTCRVAAGRLVVSQVKVAPNGKAVRKQSPSSQAASSSSSSQGRSGPSSSSDDSGDDNDSGTADNDSGTADNDSGTADNDSNDADDDGNDADDDGNDADDDGNDADDDEDDDDD
jgi:hypothetical protein